MSRRLVLGLAAALMAVACNGSATTTQAPAATEASQPPVDFDHADLEAAFARAMEQVDDPRIRAVLEQAKENTIEFADVAMAEAAGYQRSPNGCEAGAGLHYVNRNLIDDVTGTAVPEAIMYAVEETGLRLVGIEYFVPGTRLDPTPDILGLPARGPLQIPGIGSIYWQHVWLYDPPTSGLFGALNLTVGCWSG